MKKSTILLCLIFILAFMPAYGQGAAISSGKIHTLGKFSFMHGRMDINVKIPRTADGLFPSLRLVGADYNTVGWPDCGEIILMEMGHHSGIETKNQVKAFTSGVRWGPRGQDGSHPSRTALRNNTYALQYGGFHLISLIWSRQRIRMYLDLDKLPAEQRAQAKPYFEIEITPEMEKFFNKPFAIVLSLAAGGEYTGITSIDNVTALNQGNSYQASMCIDYIRVADSQNKLILDEDFRSARIDSAKWNVEESNGINGELQNFRRQNIRIDRDGITGKNCLIITAKRE